MLGRIRRYVYSRAAVIDVRRGHAAKLQACLDAGADANWRTQPGPGFHLLDIAVLHGHLEIVNTLLSAGANPNAKNDDGSTPLHTAARVARPAILDALLEAGGNPNDRDEDDVTVLHRAIMFRVDDTSRGQRITAEDKVVLGADPTAESQDLVGVVRILINAGADPNAEMRDVGTAVHLVAKRDTLIPAPERDSGVTEALVDIMKKGGADIDRKTVCLSEMAPIHAAVRTGHDSNSVEGGSQPGHGGFAWRDRLAPCLLGTQGRARGTAIFCIAGLVRVVGRRSDGVERKARVGEAGSVASGVGERSGTGFGLKRDAEGAVRTHRSHRGYRRAKMRGVIKA